MTAKAAARKQFNEQAAPDLADQVRTPSKWDGSGSAHFAYFADDDHFVVVAGPQEESAADLALAYGLTYRDSRRLVLVLPVGYAFPTLQRSAWLVPDARPDVRLHDRGSVQRRAVPNFEDTINELSGRLKPGQTLDDELRDAATPLHLGDGEPAVFDLAEWATKNPDLDPSHRKSERAWHCMGQKVLSIRRESGGLRVRAGIHESGGSKGTLIPKGERLVGDRLAGMQGLVERGIDARLRGSYQKPDEHWLQAVVRRDPAIVGIEHPALRELPAWRPGVSGPAKPDAATSWSRGFIDLVGVDGHADIRIVETKLSTNPDALFIFQGLDYYIWAHAYEAAIRERLGAPKKSRIILHYVLGALPDGAVQLSQFSLAQARALSPEVECRFQVIRNWYEPEEGPGFRPYAELLDPGEIPQ